MARAGLGWRWRVLAIGLGIMVMVGFGLAADDPTTELGAGSYPGGLRHPGGEGRRRAGEGLRAGDRRASGAG